MRLAFRCLPFYLPSSRLDFVQPSTHEREERTVSVLILESPPPKKNKNGSVQHFLTYVSETKVLPEYVCNNLVECLNFSKKLDQIIA